MELGSGDCGATRWQSRCLPTLLSLSFRFFFSFLLVRTLGYVGIVIGVVWS